MICCATDKWFLNVNLWAHNCKTKPLFALAFWLKISARHLFIYYNIYVLLSDEIFSDQICSWCVIKSSAHTCGNISLCSFIAYSCIWAKSIMGTRQGAQSAEGLLKVKKSCLSLSYFLCSWWGTIAANSEHGQLQWKSFFRLYMHVFFGGRDSCWNCYLHASEF